MAAKLYRCLNAACSDADEGAAPVFDFEGEEARCPRCGAAQKDSPHLIAERALIHYLVNDDAGAIRTPNGRRGVACDPARAGMPRHATGVAGAVTCPRCRASETYLAHVAGSVDQSRRIVTDVPPQLAGGGA